MVQRVVYTIRWQKHTQRWVCRELQWDDGLKAGLVQSVARYCVARWENEGKLGQLRIFGKNGRIQSERTYGRDPRRFPG
jgi:hypothetical protein